jgi:branched-chain amino acid transport system ATP-binding protein
MSDLPPLLEIEDLHVHYGKQHVLHGVSLVVPPGEVVALIGRNGAGKTTIARAATGLVRSSAGHVHFAGEELTNRPPHEIVWSGVAHVPEGRRVFAKLSVRENLLVGGYSSDHTDTRLEYVVSLFPVLGEKLRQRAGQLSGGQQQMLAIGRALMAEPRLIVIDEPTMGLAPVVVKHLAESLRELVARDGMTVLLMDQQTSLASRVATRAHVLREGRVVAEVAVEQLRSADVRAMYLGDTPVEQERRVT